MKRNPLVWNGTLLYPSFGVPISKAARAELIFFLPMLVDRGAPPPATTLELVRGGQSLGIIDVPTSAPDDDSLRQVGTLPVDKLPVGVYELKATIRVWRPRGVANCRIYAGALDRTPLAFVGVNSQPPTPLRSNCTNNHDSFMRTFPWLDWLSRVRRRALGPGASAAACHGSALLPPPSSSTSSRATRRGR